MGRPRHRVQLVQVVGHHPQIDQPLTQFGQHVGPVVDPAEQHGLVQQGHARIDQPAECLGHRRVDFGRVVHLDHHDG